FFRTVTEIHISGAAFETPRSVARTITGFEGSLGRLAPANAQAGRKALCELNRTGGIPVFAPILEPGSQQLPCRSEHGIGIVFGILLTALINIADGDYLNFWELQQIHHHDHALTSQANHG